MTSLLRSRFLGMSRNAANGGTLSDIPKNGCGGHYLMTCPKENSELCFPETHYVP